jgi:hypothetical protein
MVLMSGWIAADTLDQDRAAPRVSPPLTQYAGAAAGI